MKSDDTNSQKLPSSQYYPPSPSVVKTPTPPLPKNDDVPPLTSPAPISTPSPDDATKENIPTPSPLISPPSPISTTPPSVGMPMFGAVQESIIGAPKKDEVPTEANFPGQPVPESEQVKLEQKAEHIVGVTSASKAKKTKKIMQTMLGVLALMLVGTGVYFGQELVSTTGVGDLRQQAMLDEGTSAGGGGAATPIPDDHTRGGGCFLAGTKISMADGSYKNIEEIRPGEEVISFSNDGKISSYVVRETAVNKRDFYYEVLLDNGTVLKLTDNHPVMIKNDNYMGWASLNPQATFTESGLHVISYKSGDFVMGEDRKWKRIASVTKIGTKVTVYNLSNVETSKSFFADGVLVHNKLNFVPVPTGGTCPSDYPEKIGDNCYNFDNGSSTAGCKTGFYQCNVGCCGVGGTPTEGQRYSPIFGDCEECMWDSNTPWEEIWNDPVLGPVVKREWQDRGIGYNDNGTIVWTPNTEMVELLGSSPGLQQAYNEGLCKVVAGGYLYCGGYRDGTTCEPILSGGGDWCQIIAENGGVEYTGKCSEVGLVRCICNNGVGVIGTGSCDNLCGSTLNTCESCPPGNPPPPSNPPGSSLACTGLTVIPASPQLGDAVRFTCSGSSSPTTIHHYDFQYKVGDGAYQDLAAASVGSAQSQQLTITQTGSYAFRCRACVSTDTTNCSAWQTQ